MNLEIELQHKDGHKISALVSAAYRQNENGEIIGVQGTMRDISAIKQAEAERLRAKEFEEISITDPLTKIYNRRFLYEAAEKEIERAKRSSSSLSVILFDIDHFKNVNDTYGHLTGDQVLINLVILCQQYIRSMDIFTRFGGEEFVILMPDTNGKSAGETAERLRKIVDGKSMTRSGTTAVSVTISLGITNWYPENPIEINALLDQADQALYKAKEAGRNQVMVWNDA
jgi:two-component system, cell cycle response regulator